MVAIRQMLIPDSRKPKFTVNGKKVTLSMRPTGVTIHETSNVNRGANALAHARLQQNGNSRNASWHLQVDENEIIQSLPFNEAGLHAGDGVNGTGNRTTIAIEICVNSDGDYRKAVNNAAELTKYLTDKFNIPISNIKQHNDWSGKNCPTLLRNGSRGINWNGFIDLVKKSGKKTGGVVISNTGDHVVQSGETFSGIASTYKVSLNELKKLNPSIKDYNVITVGQKINVPEVKQATAPLPAQKVDSTATTHKVANGDTLFGIAARYGTTVNSLKSINKLTSDTILVGQTLQLRQAAVTPTPKPTVTKPIRPFVRTYRYMSPMMSDRALRGTDIAAIQRAVGASPDGFYGKNTQLRVMEYQRRQGLTRDGIVGPKTWNVMF